VRIERPVPWPTVLAAVASLFVLTTGPLYRLRTWWDYEDPLATDAFVVVLNAAIGLVAFSWLVSQGRFRQLDQRALAVAAALVGWLLLGSLWSLNRLETFRHAMQIASALTVGAAIAAALGAVWFRWVLWAGLHVGLVWSVIAIYLHRSGTLDNNSDWAGVYYNRNFLALYAALALLVAVFLAADARSIESAAKRWAVVAVLVGFGAVDVRLIAGSDALTPVVSFTVALAAVAVCWAGSRLVRRDVDANRLAAVVGLVALAAAVVAWTTRRSWLDELGRRGDLTGRVAAWNVSLDWAWRRPLHGYGYMAAWREPGFQAEVEAARGRVLVHAHNSFVDVFLGAGLIGLALAVGLVAALYWRTVPVALRMVSAATLFPVALLVFVVVENLTETLLVGNQLIVALLGSLLWPRPEPVSDVAVSDEAAVPVDEGSGVLGGPAEFWRMGPRGRAQPLEQLAIVDQPLHRVGERGVVGDRHDEAVRPVGHDLGGPEAVARDHGQPGGERLPGGN
jgi:exopolysaccharide production protein ExoQ